MVNPRNAGQFNDAFRVPRVSRVPGVPMVPGVPIVPIVLGRPRCVAFALRHISTVGTLGTLGTSGTLRT